MGRVTTTVASPQPSTSFDATVATSTSKSFESAFLMCLFQCICSDPHRTSRNNDREPGNGDDISFGHFGDTLVVHLCSTIIQLITGQPDVCLSQAIVIRVPYRHSSDGPRNGLQSRLTLTFIASDN